MMAAVCTPLWYACAPVMRRLFGLSIGLSLVAFASQASAERIAVLALPSLQGSPPVIEADRLCARAISHKHQAVCSADASARLRAGNQPPDAAWAASLQQSVAQARGALTRLDRHGATALTRQIESAIRQYGGGTAGAEVLVEYALLERSLAASAGVSTTAARWLRVAAALGPTVALDPLTHPEDERHSFAQAVSELASTAPGTLMVKSSPASAEVWVDGVRRCATPCSAKLPPGHHFALVTASGHAPDSFELEMAPGASQQREIGLSAAYAGAPLEAIAAMLANPSRSGEASAAIVPIARFLDVDRVVVVQSEGSGRLRAMIVTSSGSSVRDTDTTDEAVAARLGQGSSPGDSDSGSKPWYRSTPLWIGVGVVVAGAIATGVYLGTRGDDAAPGTATLVIGGR